MEIELSSAKVDVEAPGFKPGAYVGTKALLLHSGTGYLQFAADDENWTGPPTSGPAVRFKGTVNVLATAKDRADLNNWKFGFIQVAQIFNYRFRYAGQTPEDGHCTFNIDKGFTDNPCLDAMGSGDVSIRAFEPPKIFPLGGAQSGFKIDVKDVDNPSSLVPLRIENGITSKENYLYEAWRDEAFLTCFAARSPAGKLSILGSFRWKVVWHFGLGWRDIVFKPWLRRHHAQLVGFDPQTGEPEDNSLLRVAKTGAPPYANDLDKAAVQAAINKREPFLSQRRGYDPDTPTDIFDR